MKYFYDTEFLENGSTIELISIGIIAEDGREYYAVNSDMPLSDIVRHDWLAKNVVPHLPVIRDDPFEGMYYLDKTSRHLRPHWMIRNEVRDFLLADDGRVELWADYAAYDHVALCQLFGRMIDLPAGIPMYTNDIQQLRTAIGAPQMLIPTSTDEHNALVDARHCKTIHDILVNQFERDHA